MDFKVTVPDAKGARLVEAFSAVFGYQAKVQQLVPGVDGAPATYAEVDNPETAEQLMCRKIGQFAIDIGNQLVSQELDAVWDASFAQQKFVPEDVTVTPA